MGKRIGLIDVDGHNFPNIPLMKLSAYHKMQGDSVEWYNPLSGVQYDICYMSKVFSFTPDYEYFVNAEEVVKSGSGYAIQIIDGKETYNKDKDPSLPHEIEHTYPDYSLYPNLTKDRAFGFMTRGCPRGCAFCHTGAKEGTRSRKVADLSEFWRGQKKIILCDPNLLACQEWETIIQQLIESRALININQGLDIRMMTPEKAEMIKQLRVEVVHFAWDRYEDRDIILPKLKEFKEVTGWGARKTSVFILTNFDTTTEQDLERIYTVRDLGYDPFVMIYRKETLPPDAPVRRMQRWVNNKIIFKSVKNFDDYNPKH